MSMSPLVLVSLFTLVNGSSARADRDAAPRAAAAAAAAVGTAVDCERVWPDATTPTPRRSRACASYFLAQGYGPAWTWADLETEPLVGTQRSWRFSAHRYRTMASHVAASCDGRCDRIASRAIEFFEHQSAAQLGVVDPWTLESFEPLLARILAGDAIDETDLAANEDLPWSPMTLWKLRGAVFARHGATFEHPDLERFFYGDRGSDAMPVDILPLSEPRVQGEVVLESVDRENLAVLFAYEEATRGEGEQGP
jgi:hypothetical protein